MGQTFRATALAMVISIGNIGAIIGTQLYRTPLGGLANPNYRISFALTIVWLGIGMISATALWYGLARANRRILEDRAHAQQGEANSSASSDDSSTLRTDGRWRQGFLYQT